MGAAVRNRAALDVEAIDLEVTQAIHYCRWDLTFAAGVRYGAVHVSGAEDLLLEAGVFPVGILSESSLQTSQRFDGVGPTVALEGRRRLGNSNLSIYGNARGSLLFGNYKRRARFENAGLVGFIFDPDEFEYEVDLASDRGDDLLTVLEMQLGMEYAREMGYGALFFVRGGFEAQVWQGAGGYGNLLSGLEGIESLTGLAGGGLASIDGDIGFIGATVAVGVMR